MPRTEVSSGGPRSGFRIGMLLLGMLPLFFAVAGTVIYVKTDKGTIAIETDDPNVRVIVEQNGSQVKILDQKNNQEAILNTGTYSLRLGGDVAGFDLSLPEGEPFSLKRGEEKIVTVRRVNESVVPQVESSVSRGVDGHQGVEEPQQPGDVPLVRQLEGHAGPIYGLAVWADGQRAVSTDITGQVRMWDLKAGRTIRTFETQPHRLGARGVAIAPDQETLAVSDGNGLVYLLDTETGRELQRWQAREEGIPAIAFSPDGDRLAVVGWGRSALRIWNVNRDSVSEVPLPAGTTGAMDVAYSPDGREIAAGGYQLYRYDATSGRLLGAVDFKAKLVHSVAYSPDGELLACGLSDGSLAVIDRETREQRIFSGHTDAASGLIFTPDGRRLISGGRDRTLRVWDVSSGQEILRHTAGIHIFNRLALASDGRTLLSGGGWYYDKRLKEDISDGDHVIRIWKLPESVRRPEAGELKLLDGFQAVEENGIIRDVGVASGGRFVLALGEGPFDAQRPLQVWDTETGVHKTFRTGGYISLAVSPNGEYLALGEAAGGIHFLKIPELELSRATVSVLPWPESLSFGSQRKTIANVGGMVKKDWAVQLWDWETPEKLHQLSVEQDLETVRVSPDGKRLLIGVKGGRPLIWTPDSDNALDAIALAGSAYALAWLPDSHRVLVGLSDGRIVLYDPSENQVVRRFEGHIAEPHDLELLPGGNRFLSGGRDGTLRLWSLATGEQLAVAEVGRAGTMHIDVSADGRFAVTGGGQETREKQIEPIGNGDGKVRLWRLPVSESLEDAERGKNERPHGPHPGGS